MEWYYWVGLVVYFMFGARTAFSLSVIFMKHRNKFTQDQIDARHFGYFIAFVFWPVFIGRL